MKGKNIGPTTTLNNINKICIRRERTGEEALVAAINGDKVISTHST